VSLTTGRGPLSPRRAGAFRPPIPDDVVYVEPFPRRVRAFVSGECVVDSEAVVLVHRSGAPPSYAFPSADVTAPAEPEPAAEGHVRVAWNAVDEWYEEEEPVFGHPRNPYHRVDCVPTARRLRVAVAGVELAAADRTLGVYETALEPKLYVDRSAVQMELLRPSDTTTYCPYKGTASYWTAVVREETVVDAAWSYDDPLDECRALRELLCFDAGRPGLEVVHDLPPAR
jgi:uncharacterized protein (DUF427 family)